MKNKSLNKGIPLSFDEINNYEKAAKDFAEGNKALERLLLNCFSKGIKTHACCGGHHEDNLDPYIAFSYNKENEQYIYSILSELVDTGLVFGYSKLTNGRSFISIEGDALNTKSLFDKINQIIDSVNINKDYYIELPIYLQKYVSLIKSAEYDNKLKVDLFNFFQIEFRKNSKEYECTLFTNNEFYNDLFEQNGFKNLLGEKPSNHYMMIEKDKDKITENFNNILQGIQELSKICIKTK